MAITQFRSTIWGRWKDLANAKVVWLCGSGAATNAVTGRLIAGPGSLYTDIVGKTIRMNTGTLASPNWGILASDEARSESTSARTVADSGTTEFYLMAPKDGKLVTALFVTSKSLPISNTNYIILSITNLGQNGTGNAAMLTGSPFNSSKTNPIVANVPRTLDISTVLADITVAKYDRLRLRVAVVGTLPDALDNAQFTLDIQA